MIHPGSCYLYRSGLAGLIFAEFEAHCSWSIPFTSPLTAALTPTIDSALLIDFFRQNRRRMRAIELNRERREIEDRTQMVKSIGGD